MASLSSPIELSRLSRTGYKMKLWYVGLTFCVGFAEVALANPIERQEQRSFGRGTEASGRVSSAVEIRDLRLGQLNFLHTTDTHGWMGSHPAEENYNAHWGHFVSFIDRFKHNRIFGDRDLIVIDTGDKHDGNGLSDATEPNGVETNKIFNEADYDLLTLGNHELYSPERATFEYHSTATAPKFKDKYVSSNVEYIHDDGTITSFGNKFAYFETPNTGTRILALSFMFNFQKKNSRVKVTSAVEEVHKRWFKRLTHIYNEDNLDLLVIFGHMPATDEENQEINILHEYIRESFPEIIIQYFGGHSHIRDFVELDPKSTCLQSGRFAETVGFLSIDNVTSPEPQFFRKYIDFNQRSFSHHSQSKKLLTDKGRYISERLQTLETELGLDIQYGVVSQNYYMMTRPIDSDENIYKLLKDHVLKRLIPDIQTISKHRFIMLNTGAVRFDLFKGPFTRGTEFTVLPFPNTWKYIQIPLSVANVVESYLNEGPVISMLSPPGVNNQIHGRPDLCPFIKDPSLKEGYTTRDDYGCDGDDVLHNTQKLYPIPNVIQYNNVHKTDDPDTIVDYVFFSFITTDILKAVNDIQKNQEYSVPGQNFKYYDENDCKDYGGKSARELLRDYIIEKS